MHKTSSETATFFERFHDIEASLPATVDVVICPPFTALQAAAQALGGSRVALGAQNMHWEPQGAYTGEISAPMLLDLGVRYVILGHSERRQYFGETDADVERKTRAALDARLTPIVAVGETLEIREAGNAIDYVVAQVRAALGGLDDAALSRVVLAYEPVWAIGTGRNCDPAAANEVMGAIRACAPALADVPILYGGSVKPENIGTYTAQSEIDGGLVGGASLDPSAFARLVKEAA